LNAIFDPFSYPSQALQMMTGEREETHTPFLQPSFQSHSPALEMRSTDDAHQRLGAALIQIGRQAKDIALHELQGTTLRSSMPGESAVPGSLPRPPKFLSKEARKKFKGLVKQLAPRRAVTQGDCDLITIYCRTFMRWLQAMDSIDKEGLIVEYERLDKDGKVHLVKRPNISLKIAETTERQMLSYLVRLGLTPKDRDHVRPTSLAPTGKEPPDPNSREGMMLEADRLREQIAAEKETQGEDYGDGLDSTGPDDDESGEGSLGS
jgi:P27 family predicted phage terminase small subunit